ncbi:MAG: PQQ-binding-like beta-propeller repeat protein [Acidobacteriota bacterium]|nr:PQQ-binding-like beta-propeller repeat protein [Acidobacteriota bacterium]
MFLRVDGVTRSCRAALLAALASMALASAASSEWPVYGGGNDQIRYSRATQIDTSNVHNLQAAWTYDTGDSFPGSELQCNPLVIGGVLYGTTPKLRVIALAADSGKLLWQFDPHDGKDYLRKSRNRGLTYWTDGKSQRLYFAVESRLYSLDAKTGKPAADFGQAGRVDLRQNLGRDPDQQNISLTTPGIIYRDLLIVGSITAEDLPAAPGDIRAYDVRTGNLKWSFHTIPHPGEPGYRTWPPNAWKTSGSANSWAGMALDEKRGLVFVPTGSAAFDFYGADRHGDDLFANCLLALNAATGERIWHFQFVRHDIWDRDPPSPPSLVTLQREGKRIDAVAQTTKSGHVFVFERATGKPVFPIQYKDVPQTDVPGERTSRQQPLPVKPPPFARQRLTEDLITNRTPQAHQAVLDRLRTVRSEGQFTPMSLQGTVVFPGLDGGAEWGGSAFDPESGLLYVNANEMAWIMRLVERKTKNAKNTGATLYRSQCASCHRPDRLGTPPEFPSLADIGSRRSEAEIANVIRKGAGRMPAFSQLTTEAVAAIATFLVKGEDKEVLTAIHTASPSPLRYAHDGYNRFLDPDGYPAVKPPWGTLNAIDLNKGEIRWTIPLGEYPELAAKGMADTGSENYGGPVVTAGGVVFIGATVRDRKMHAFDKNTGKLLWSAALPFSGCATPAVYEVNGREFVVIAAGGGKSGQPSGGSYVAFALPQQ